MISIGKEAFLNHNALSSVQFINGLGVIGENMFDMSTVSGNPAVLTTVTIISTITSIGLFYIFS